ncbi:hypothetical protein T4D_6000 [Trichinella pseudospiralis]|uniref:Uncharacterized protein n=1 Tax=Trichinella pseudospiralis TaxID=6337 RepID=A0A0V1F741_TRIPS|nr:hypothetical protein T4D_6000 [Trichinella pseudospiralis]
MSPPNFGSGTGCSFPSCNCGPNFTVKAGFTTDSLHLSFSFKEVSARVRVVNASLRNWRHSLRAASRDSPSGRYTYRIYKLKNREEMLGCSKDKEGCSMLTYLEVAAVISQKHHMESCLVDQHLAYKMEKKAI